MTARVRYVRRVRKEHGAIFVEAFIELSCDVMWEAFAETGIMAWPDDERAQGHYQDVEDEILDRTFDAVRDAIATAFVEAATDVLEREGRGRR